MQDYRAALAKGWDIGSGPTDVMGRTLALLLKRSGMKWDADHTAAKITLLAMRESNQHQKIVGHANPLQLMQKNKATPVMNSLVHVRLDVRHKLPDIENNW